MSLMFVYAFRISFFVWCSHMITIFSNIGPRSYFLRGKLAELEQSLIGHVSSQLQKHGFLQMVGPDMFKTTVVVRLVTFIDI